MENQAGSSSSGSEHSTHNQLALTEENLDYFLRKEYTSQMCFDGDQMSLETLGKSASCQNLENPSHFDAEESTQDNISIEKMVVGQDDSHCTLPKDLVGEKNEEEDVRTKTLNTILELNLCGKDILSLFNFCQSEYGDNAVYMWRENLREVWETKKSMEEKAAQELAMKAAKVSNELDCLKTNDMNNSTSTDNSIPFNINYCVNSKIKFDNWENASFTKYFVDEQMEIPKEIPISTSTSVSNGTCQIQSSSVPPTKLKKLGGLNTASEYITSTQNDGLNAKKNSNSTSSVRDLALASSSSHDIEYIDADEDGLGSPMSEITFYKTDTEDSKRNKTLSSINKTHGNIDLEELLNTFTESTNLHIRNINFENVVPAKSSLKRKISEISTNKKVKKVDLKFTSVTIFYFERSQGFSSIPTKGGSTLGMENQHFYISTIPIDEYEHRKVQKQQPNLRSNNIIYHRKFHSRGKSKNVQALSLNQRIELLESAEVQIEVKEEVDCAHIRSSRALAGCECKEYCDPDICYCSLSGIECQVDRPNFPCGCTRENCRNVMGRNEYNHGNIKIHFTKTMRKIKLENKGRTFKRKQASPTKVIIKNPEITKDIDMIQI